MDTTEAAGEYLINPALLSNLWKSLGLTAGSNRGFEVLFKSKELAGTSRDSQIVASRVWAEE
jgi:hypothetical protein